MTSEVRRRIEQRDKTSRHWLLVWRQVEISFSSGALFHLPQGRPFDIVGPGSHRSTCRRPNADTSLVRGTETRQHHSYTQELSSLAMGRLLSRPPASASHPPASAKRRLQDT